MNTRLDTRTPRDENVSGNALSDADFHSITKIAEDEAGLSIPVSKKALVQSRVSKRMRILGLSDFSEYLALVAPSQNRAERRELISILTTNVSSFFREEHHLEFLNRSLAPTLKAKLDADQPVRIWSAGCSSGQEAYSIAMTSLRSIPDAAEKNFLILGTDIDPAILSRAMTATYTSAEIAGVPKADLRRHFTASDVGTTFTVRDPLRAMIRFRELNLHAEWPMRMKFDAIFCRNVMIYFDDLHQQRLWPRFHAALVPGGYLFLGHSERIHPLEGSGFATAGVTMYRRI